MFIKSTNFIHLFFHIYFFHIQTEQCMSSMPVGSISGKISTALVNLCFLKYTQKSTFILSALKTLSITALCLLKMLDWAPFIRKPFTEGINSGNCTVNLYLQSNTFSFLWVSSEAYTVNGTDTKAQVLSLLWTMQWIHNMRYITHTSFFGTVLAYQHAFYSLLSLLPLVQQRNTE